MIVSTTNPAINSQSKPDFFHLKDDIAQFEFKSNLSRTLGIIISIGRC